VGGSGEFITAGGAPVIGASFSFRAILNRLISFFKSLPFARDLWREGILEKLAKEITDSEEFEREFKKIKEDASMENTSISDIIDLHADSSGVNKYDLKALVLSLLVFSETKEELKENIGIISGRLKTEKQMNTFLKDFAMGVGMCNAILEKEWEVSRKEIYETMINFIAGYISATNRRFVLGDDCHLAEFQLACTRADNFEELKSSLEDWTDIYRSLKYDFSDVSLTTFVLMIQGRDGSNDALSIAEYLSFFSGVAREIKDRDAVARMFSSQNVGIYLYKIREVENIKEVIRTFKEELKKELPDFASDVAVDHKIGDELRDAIAHKSELSKEGKAGTADYIVEWFDGRLNKLNSVWGTLFEPREGISDEDTSTIRQKVITIIRGFIEKDKNVLSPRVSSIGTIVREMIKHGIHPERAIVEAVTETSKLNLKFGGGSDSSVANFAGGVIKDPDPLSLLELPLSPPEFKSVDQEQFVDMKEIPSGHKINGIHRIMGRTIVYTTEDGKYIAFKFQKTGEDPDKLVRESKFFTYLNSLKNEGVPLQGNYPEALGTFMVHGSLHIAQDETAGTVVKRLNTSLDGAGTVEAADDRYKVMAYITEDKDYFTYLHEIEGEDEARSAYRKNLTDLFLLAKYGLIHPDITELFHDKQRGREGRSDGGKYIPMVDMMFLPAVGFGSGQGPGELSAWEQKYPNVRGSGLADTPEVMTLSELSKFISPHSKYLLEGHQKNVGFGGRTIGLVRFTESQRGKFLLAHFLGNYLLSCALIEGKRLKDQPGMLPWENPESLARMMRDQFKISYDTFTGKSDDIAASYIDWNMLARQMAFFMNGDYVEILENGKQFPEGLFESGTKIEFPSKPLEEPGWVKGKGWMLDAKNPDLGPANGSLPLQELIKAICIYTSFMVAEGPGEIGTVLEESTTEPPAESPATVKLADIAKEKKVLFIHSILPNYIPGDNSPFKNGVDWRVRLEVLLNLRRSISASSFKVGDDGDGVDNMWGRMGVILDGGEIEYAYEKDAGVVSTGVWGTDTSTSFEMRGESIAESVDLAIDKRKPQGPGSYNEFRIKNPRVAGFYICLDKSHKGGPSDIVGHEEIFKMLNKYKMPLFVIKGGRLYEGSYDEIDGIIIPMEEISSDVIIEKRFKQPSLTLTSRQINEIRAGLKDNEPFRWPWEEAVKGAPEPVDCVIPDPGSFEGEPSSVAMKTPVGIRKQSSGRDPPDAGVAGLEFLTVLSITALTGIIATAAVFGISFLGPAEFLRTYLYFAGDALPSLGWLTGLFGGFAGTAAPGTLLAGMGLLPVWPQEDLARKDENPYQSPSLLDPSYEELSRQAVFYRSKLLARMREELFAVKISLERAFPGSRKDKDSFIGLQLQEIEKGEDRIRQLVRIKDIEQFHIRGEFDFLSLTEQNIQAEIDELEVNEYADERALKYLRDALKHIRSIIEKKDLDEDIEKQLGELFAHGDEEKLNVLDDLVKRARTEVWTADPGPAARTIITLSSIAGAILVSWHYGGMAMVAGPALIVIGTLIFKTTRRLMRKIEIRKADFESISDTIHLNVVRAMQTIEEYKETVNFTPDSSLIYSGPLGSERNDPADVVWVDDGDIVKDRLRGYDKLIKGIVPLLGEDPVFIYPFAGLDPFPARHGSIYPVNNDPKDFERAVELLKIAELKLSDGPDGSSVIKSAYDEKRDAFSMSDYPDMSQIKGTPVLVMKGFGRYSRKYAPPDSPEAGKGALLKILDKLRPGDKVLVLDARDLMMLEEAGFLPDNEKIHEPALCQIHNRSKVFHLPDIVAVFEKTEEGTLKKIISEPALVRPVVSEEQTMRVPVLYSAAGPALFLTGKAIAEMGASGGMGLMLAGAVIMFITAAVFAYGTFAVLRETLNPASLTEIFPGIKESIVKFYLKRLFTTDGKVSERILKRLSRIEKTELEISVNRPGIEFPGHLTIRDKHGHRHFVVDKSGNLIERYIHDNDKFVSVTFRDLSPQNRYGTITMKADPERTGKYDIYIEEERIGWANPIALSSSQQDTKFKAIDRQIVSLSAKDKDREKHRRIIENTYNLFAKWAREDGKKFVALNVTDKRETDFLRKILDNPLKLINAQDREGEPVNEAFIAGKETRTGTDQFVNPIGVMAGDPDPLYVTGFGADTRIERYHGTPAEDPVLSDKPVPAGAKTMAPPASEGKPEKTEIVSPSTDLTPGSAETSPDEIEITVLKGRAPQEIGALRGHLRDLGLEDAKDAYLADRLLSYNPGAMAFAYGLPDHGVDMRLAAQKEKLSSELREFILRTKNDPNLQKRIVLHFIGIGREPVELRETLAMFLKELDKSGEKRSDWSVVAYAMEADQSLIPISDGAARGHKFTEALSPLTEHGLESLTIKPCRVNVLDREGMAEVRKDAFENYGRTADFIFFRNVYYLTSYYSRVVGRDAQEKAKEPRIRNFIALSNIFSIAEEGAILITEPTEDILVSDEKAKEPDIVYPGTSTVRGTGIYRIEEPGVFNDMDPSGLQTHIANRAAPRLEGPLDGLLPLFEAERLDRLALTGGMLDSIKKSGGIEGISRIKAEIKKQPIERRAEFRMALRTGCMVEGMSNYHKTGHFNVVSQVVQVGRVNGARGHIQRIIKNLGQFPYKLFARSDIKEFYTEHDLPRVIGEAVDSCISALDLPENKDWVGRAVIMVPESAEKFLKYEEIDGRMVSLQDERIVFQIIDSGEDPDLVSLFGLGFNMLEYDRLSSEAKQDENNYRGLLYLLTAMLDGEEDPRDIIKRLFAPGSVITIQLAEWQDIANQRAAWEAIDRSL